MVEKFSKKGQLTLFIILGVAILIVLILLFTDNDLASLLLGKSPVQRIEDCSEDSLKEGMKIVMAQGGGINPENYYLYKDDKIEYICFTEKSFQKCVMQKPLLKESVENELTGYVQVPIKKCVNDVVSSLEGRGNDVSLKEPEIIVELVQGSVLVDIDLDLKIVKGEDSQSYKNIKIDVSSKLYDFVIVAGLIANTEAEYGDSDTMPHMYRDKKLKVEKIKQGDETKVYILTDRESDDKFNFAVKSIPIPPGWIEPENFE